LIDRFCRTPHLSTMKSVIPSARRTRHLLQVLPALWLPRNQRVIMDTVNMIRNLRAGTSYKIMAAMDTHRIWILNARSVVIPGVHLIRAILQKSAQSVATQGSRVLKCVANKSMHTDGNSAALHSRR
jgi:hypothetical protein